MKTIDLVQGSDSWLAHRRNHYNASDAPAMMGASKYTTRAQLIERTVTGVTPEIDERTQRLFDRGHEVEAKARPLADAIVGDELYPATATSDEHFHLSASFDGVTMDESIIWECKLWNDKLAESVRNGIVPETHVWQLEHQLLVSRAEKCLFMVTDGETEVHCWYVSDPDRRSALLAGWEQFAKDCESWTPSETPEVIRPVGRMPETLPELRIEARGMVTASNLDAFRENALAVIRSIKRELVTDEDFADGIAAVKWCKRAEEKLEETKAGVLAQMADVNAVCQTLDELKAEARQARLAVDKLVTSETTRRKSEIVHAGADEVHAYYEDLNKGLGAHAMALPSNLTAEIGAVTKGMSKPSSMQDAVDSAVANAKIAAAQQASRISANMEVLRGNAEYAGLFADAIQLCATKTEDDLRNLVKARIAEHKQREDARLEAERARIRAEEEAKAKREADAKAEQDRQAIRAEEQAAARKDAEDRRRVEAHASLERAEQSLDDPRPQRQAAQPSPGHAPQGGGAAPMPPANSEQSPQHDSGARLKLGDLNARIAPLAITADGLAQIGFPHVGQEKAAKLYRACDFPAIVDALINRLMSAANQKRAA